MFEFNLNFAKHSLNFKKNDAIQEASYVHCSTQVGAGSNLNPNANPNPNHVHAPWIY